MAPDKIVIRKYANRRLYDTSTSRYINLEDIAAMVRNGKDVQVVDASTGEDVTRVTLTQIIVEDARGQPSGLPLELLRQLIVASDRVGQEFIMWYLKSAFDAYQKVQSSVQDRVSQIQSAAMSPLNPADLAAGEDRRRRRRIKRAARATGGAGSEATEAGKEKQKTERCREKSLAHEAHLIQARADTCALRGRMDVMRTRLLGLRSLARQSRA